VVTERQRRAKNEKRPIIRDATTPPFSDRTVQSTAAAAPLASQFFAAVSSCTATQRDIARSFPRFFFSLFVFRVLGRSPSVVCSASFVRRACI